MLHRHDSTVAHNGQYAQAKRIQYVYNTIHESIQEPRTPRNVYNIKECMQYAYNTIHRSIKEPHQLTFGY